MKNMGKTGQAGCHRRRPAPGRFVGDVPWVHLDIAGPAWSDSTTAPVEGGDRLRGPDPARTARQLRHRRLSARRLRPREARPSGWDGTAVRRVGEIDPAALARRASERQAAAVRGPQGPVGRPTTGEIPAARWTQAMSPARRGRDTADYSRMWRPARGRPGDGRRRR